MKKKLRSIGLVAAAVAFVATGCDNGITDLNRNPNSPDEATPEFLFANATEAAVSRTFGDPLSSVHADFAALWIQHYAEHRFSQEDRYLVADANISGHWSSFYAGPLQDYQEAITLAVDADRVDAAATARIMRAWTFHVVTDLWGDVGYSEALQGRNPSSGNTPAFDPQQQVYEALFAELDEAQASFVGAGVGLGGADLIYGGDVDLWAKFANSLRLRLAMRLSEADATLARSEFADALAAGVFTDNDDNAVLTYIEGGTNVHPIYDYEQSRDDHSVSATIIDTLISYSDPRLPIYAKPTAAGTYVGMANGSLTQPSLAAISHIGEFFSRANAPAFLLTYDEVLFLQAEAAERGWTTADAGALYTAGIRAAMERVGVGSAAIDAYLLQPEVVYAGGTAGLMQIGLQKWIALFGNGVEAYSDWRRTGYPMLLPGPDAENDGQIPLRFPYPNRERSLNGTNLDIAIARQGGASLNDPVWWDR